MTTVTLRPVAYDDLSVFFAHQQDAEAVHMAAFGTAYPADREAFMKRWARIRSDERMMARTILADDAVAGYVASFPDDGQVEVTYWLGKPFWGRGIATRALTLLLDEVRQRPLRARSAKDNIASIRVLEKCGFAITDEARGFAAGRGVEVAEYVMTLGG